MENKQTAVEFLIYHIKQDRYVHCKSTKEWNQVFAQAKQIEKEQIIEARDSYINQMLKVNDDLLIYGESKFKEMNAEQYYNETYGK